MDNWELAGDLRQARMVANHVRVSGVLWIWLGVDET